MPENQDNPATQAVTGNFSINAQMSTGKQISVSGYLYDGESVESVNARLDLLHDVIDRQRMRAEIPDLESALEKLITSLNMHKEGMQALEKKKELGGKLSSQEKNILDNMLPTLQRISSDIEKGRSVIEDNKRKAGLT